MKSVQITNGSNIPIYQQLYEQIAMQIYKGDMKEDSMIPSIRKTAKELRVSVITIKKAWEMLEANGLIYTVPGKGSYVAAASKTDLKKKRESYVVDLLGSNIDQVKKLGYSKEEIIDIINKIY